MTDELVDHFLAHEGSAGAQWVLGLVARHHSGQLKVESNVWQLEFDFDAGTVRLEHIFDPLEGSLSIAEFVRALESRLAVE